MEKSVLEAVAHYSMLDNGIKCVTVALSGGADSMALLHCLLSLKSRLGITVKAAHLNHMIRGNEALRDENFVKEQCAALGVELFCERADVPRYAAEKGISTELAARQLRYEFLERINEGVIATAHTASDNLETVIFNLSRGSALDGLCGIPPKRGVFIRPIIGCTRVQIEEYCEKKSIPFVTDSTNLTDDYTRNNIRHNIVPVLKGLNPSVEKTVLRTATLLREDGELLDSAADKYLSENVSGEALSVKNFESLRPPIARRVIKKYTELTRPEITLENVHIEAILSIIPKSGRISIPCGCTAEVLGGKLKIKNNCESSQTEKGYIVNITETENPLKKENKKINNLLLNNLLDCDKIVGKSVIRTRLQGDSIRLRNRGCTKTLNRLFSENKIPLPEREVLPVIADEKGVIWVYGIGVAQRCAVTEGSRRVSEITVQSN